MSASYADAKALERRVERLETTVERLVSLLLDQANDGRVELERLWGEAARVEPRSTDDEGWGQ